MSAIIYPNCRHSPIVQFINDINPQLFGGQSPSHANALIVSLHTKSRSSL